MVKLLQYLEHEGSVAVRGSLSHSLCQNASVQCLRVRERENECERVILHNVNLIHKIIIIHAAEIANL